MKSLLLRVVMIAAFLGLTAAVAALIRWLHPATSPEMALLSSIAGFVASGWAGDMADKLEKK